MTVPARRKPKPSATDEVARVLRIYDMVMDEMAARDKPQAIFSTTEPPIITPSPLPAAALTVAERIAARTED